MNPSFSNYLSDHLDRLLRDHRVVVFYDPREEFKPFLDDHEVVGTGLGDLPRICIGDTLTHLGRFEGSFFALKGSLEPVVDADKPEPLLVYVPGVERDRDGSVLMELEFAGHCYEPQLRRLARNLLRRQYTDGDIDEMLKPEGLTYHDVERFLGQEGSGKGSLLKLVLGSAGSESLLAKWLASDQHDAQVEAKLAQPELYRLIHARVGLALDEGTPLAKARHQTLRFVLVNEFRSDLAGAAPDCVGVVPEPATAEERQRVGAIAAELREKYGDDYIGLADGIEAELGLANAKLEPANLGAIDTFRFEERRLLDYAASLIAAGHHGKAMEVVAGRGHSFWVDHPSFLGRLAQWEACRLMAELGTAVDQVRPLVKKASGTAARWVEAYTAQDGWYRADRAQRALEHWVANMEDEPEEPLERALGVVRRNHEALLKEMSRGFTQALVDSSWAIPGVLHQTRIYSELVESRGGRVAYFFVDAMRYEMGADLVEQLEGAEELLLQPAVGVLPSITPLGMGALLPGAAASYSVVEHKGGLATQIGKDVLPDVGKRLKYLRAVRPDARDIRMGDLLHWSTKRVAKTLGDAPLVVVRSQEIDALGESGLEHQARQIMDSVVGNVARAVRKLAKLGVESFVITSDHGHQFSIRKSEDMIMDRPGGNEVDQHRRCWAGHGGKTPPAAVRTSAAELGYTSDLEFIFPRGLAVFRCGGDLAFHHGGCSLQEMVVPVVTLRIPAVSQPDPGMANVVVEGYPPILTTRTLGARIALHDLLQTDPLLVRVILVAGGKEVGRAGMALDTEFDRATATLTLPPGSFVNVALMLTQDTREPVRIVVQDPKTDAVLAQSDDIEVGDLL